MAVKCVGQRGSDACAVRFTCLHYVDRVLGDEMREPTTEITAAGCDGYKKMSRERFDFDFQKMKEKWKQEA